MVFSSNKWFAKKRHRINVWYHYLITLESKRIGIDKIQTVPNPRRVPLRHRNTHSVKERLFLSLKNEMNSLAFSSWPIYKSYWTNDTRRRPSYRTALDHATPLYTALGDTVKKSITSLSDLVRSIQIQNKRHWCGNTSPPFTMVI